MDRSVLLVLLCLQVFLLITTFTPTDAATLMRDPQLPPDRVKRGNYHHRQIFRRPGSNCGGRAGACGVAGVSGVWPPPPPPRPDSRSEGQEDGSGDRVIDYRW